MAQKLATLYHLLLQREQLLTSDLHTPTTLITLHRSTPVREAQADIVEAGVGRRADLGQMTLSSQISPTPGWTLPTARFFRERSERRWVRPSKTPFKNPSLLLQRAFCPRSGAHQRVLPFEHVHVHVSCSLVHASCECRPAVAL